MEEHLISLFLTEVHLHLHLDLHVFFIIGVKLILAGTISGLLYSTFKAFFVDGFVKKSGEVLAEHSMTALIKRFSKRNSRKVSKTRNHNPSRKGQKHHSTSRKGHTRRRR